MTCVGQLTKRIVHSLIAGCLAFTTFIQAAQYNALSTESKTRLVQQHNQAFNAFSHKLRNPYITVGPDGFYYLTGTSAGSHWGDKLGVQIWRSEDLVNWQDLGLVWSLYKDGIQQNSWHINQPIKNPEFKNPRAVWAPELHYFKDTWWIPHGMNMGGHGLLKSTSGKPEGPYIAMPMIKDVGVDPHLFIENNKAYYFWKGNFMLELDTELQPIQSTTRRIAHKGKHELGYDGVAMYKFGNHYLHFASGTYGYELDNSYDLYFAQSDNKLTGPYSPRKMAIKHAGNGNLFQDKNGNWWSTAFEHKYTKNWCLWLVPIDIEESNGVVDIIVKDERFKPTPADHAKVSELNKLGPPAQWQDKKPWWKPKKPTTIVHR